MTLGNVYILHFSSPVRGKSHYVGFTKRLVTSRLEYGHLDPNSIESAQLTKEAVKSNITIQIGKIWNRVTPEFEKKLKREKNLKRHCEICKSRMKSEEAFPRQSAA